MAVTLPEGGEVPTPDVERLTQDEFINEVFVPHYEPGQHVALLGPTGSGKTTLAQKLMDELATPQLPAVVLVKKPRDDVVKDWAKLSGFKITESWPPVMRRGFKKKSGGFMKNRRGWIFWPRHSLSDIRKDNKMLEKEFRKVITECYKKGDRILFIDDVIGVAHDLNLEAELKTLWSEARSMKCGLWAAAQRPFYAPVIMYGNSEHIIIFKDPDKRSRDRYEDIDGVDETKTKEYVLSLRKHEFLYIGRSMGQDGVSPAFAIVTAD